MKGYSKVKEKKQMSKVLVSVFEDNGIVEMGCFTKKKDNRKNLAEEYKRLVFY